MNPALWTYLFYVTISIALTVWVARTLHRNGRVFLVDRFDSPALADSINHLLVVGFYLINAGYIAIALRYGAKPTNAQEAVEFLSTKLGLVLLVLGAMHFFNLFVFSRARRLKARAGDTFAPGQETLDALRRAKRAAEPSPDPAT